MEDKVSEIFEKYNFRNFASMQSICEEATNDLPDIVKAEIGEPNSFGARMVYLFEDGFVTNRARQASAHPGPALCFRQSNDTANWHVSVFQK